MANQKFKFGNTPETFKRTAEIIDIEGNSSLLEFVFKYRTKKQFAELLDEGLKAAKAEHLAKNPDMDKPGIESLPDQFYAELFASNDKRSAEYILKIAKGWDVADDFNVENLMRLENDYPGSLQTISKIYAQAVSEVRTKN